MMHRCTAQNGRALVGALLGVVVLVGCRQRGVDCQERAPTVEDDALCRVPGWRNRDYLLHLPAGYDPGVAYPLVIAFHGGGGQKEGMNGLTCEDGDEASPTCLSAVADAEGFIVAYPDGTANRLGFRSWNHGGDAPGLHCSYACEQGIDDIAYFDALVDDLLGVASIDRQRIYATGFSNGGGMSHRLACARADRLAAIAAVGGANQFAAGATCSPSRPIPVLQIHGSDDPCWPYAGGEASCLPGQGGNYAGVLATVIGDERDPGWVTRNGCEPTPILSDLEDPVDDGTRGTLMSFAGCAAETALITVEGGGHSWPGGDLYLSEDRIGRLSRDFSASQRIASFFAAHSLP